MNTNVEDNVIMPMLQNVIKRINQLDARMSQIEQKIYVGSVKLRKEPISGNILYKGIRNGSIKDAD